MKEFPPRQKLKRLPYGYIVSPDDASIMLPDPEVIPYLVEALDALDSGIPLREAAETLSEKTKQTLSHAGLRSIWNRVRPDHPVKQVHPRPKTDRMTREERSKYRKKVKLSSKKKSLAALKKQIEKQSEELGLIQKEEERQEELKTAPMLEVTEYDASEIPEEREVIFRPHPGPQTEFLAATEQEVLYGGAAGGGKSYAMLADPMRYFSNPYFNGLLLRRTNDELRKLITESHQIYPKAFPGAKWKEQKNLWVFPSGAQFWLTYLENDRDVLRYQGQDFSWIGVDELTQYATPFSWMYLSSRLRVPVQSGLPTYMRATTNPGGPGHGWVKRMFIDPAPPNVAFNARDPDTGEEMIVPHGTEGFPEEMWGKPLFQRRFIPAKLSDNPSLDWKYRANLMSLSESNKRQLLDGDWTVADGAAFAEFRTHIHTCEPFEIPSNWMRFRSCDFGYSERQASAVHWYAVDPTYGTLYVYRELYVNKHTGTQLGMKIRELEQDETISYGVLDSSVWAVRGQTGPTIAEEMQRQGGRWRPSDRSQGSRIASKNRLHELLRVDPYSGKPGIIFFNTCRQIIADLPVIPSSPDDDDIDRKYATDHAYDSIRYGIQTRPRGGLGWDTPSVETYKPSDSVFGY